MFSFLVKRWFLASLTALIVLGIGLGKSFPTQIKPTADAVNPLVTTAIILFLMSLSLETKRLQTALYVPLPVGLAAALNIGLAPMLALALMPFQILPDFRYGLLVACAVPCTMAAATVWTRKAHGNDAISLLVTLGTNLASIVTIPFWLNIATAYFPLSVIGKAGDLLELGTVLDLRQTVKELVWGVLIPIFLGQVLRLQPRLNAWASHYQAQFSVVSQALILLMVWTAAAKSGVRLSQTQLDISILSIAVAWLSVIAVHLTTLYAGHYSAKAIGVVRADQIAVAFAGSQKTLPVGLLVSEAFSRQAGLSFTVFPMLMYHASQLFLDTLIADRFLAEEQAMAIARGPTGNSHRN